ncbi:MAG: SGNH/GDSL hydrolase family protein, partial [Pseudomonadota bacterium]|nr:SGNH/GDSL hydrolase family protein [Pseudomonadota bacterium]
RCSTANCPSRFAKAVAEGRPVKVLVVGDSICVIGNGPLFPQKFKQLFAGLAQIDIINGCRAGSTSPEWVPGRPLFRQALGPHIASSDLLVVSLGGNDILAFVNRYLNSVGLPSDVAGAVDMARGVVDNVITNLRAMIVEARMMNPTVDIVYLLYLDYSRSQSNQMWRFVVSYLGDQAVVDVLSAARSNFPTDIPNLMLVDLFGQSQNLDVDTYLYDELHMNAFGHTLYAEALFETLGGVRLQSNPLSDGARSPLGRRAPIGVSTVTTP